MSAHTPIEDMTRRLELGSLARQWRGVEYQNKDQHMAELAIKACEAGKRAKFFTAAPLGNTLLEKRGSGMLGRFMPTLKNTGLLVIDELWEAFHNSSYG